MQGGASVWLVNPEFGFLVSAIRHAHIVVVEIGAEEAGASAGCGRDPVEAFVILRGRLIHDVNEAFATRDVQAFAFRVVKEIVCIARDGQVRDRFAGGSIENHEPGGLAAADKEAVVRFVQGHGEICLELLCEPGGDDRTLFAVNDGYLFRIGDVDEDARALLLQLEGFGMAGEFDAGCELWAGRVNDAESAVTISKPSEFGCGIEAQVVGVGKIAEVLARVVRAAVEDLECAVVAVGNEDQVGLGQIENPGGFGHAGYALNAFAGGEVNHFEGVVAERGNEKALAFSISGEMIEAAFDARQGNGLDQLERTWFGDRNGKAEHTKSQDGGGSHAGSLFVVIVVNDFPFGLAFGFDSGPAGWRSASFKVVEIDGAGNCDPG